MFCWEKNHKLDVTLFNNAVCQKIKTQTCYVFFEPPQTLIILSSKLCLSICNGSNLTMRDQVQGDQIDSDYFSNKCVSATNVSLDDAGECESANEVDTFVNRGELQGVKYKFSNFKV